MFKIKNPISPKTVYGKDPCAEEFQKFIERFPSFYEFLTDEDIQWISENKLSWIYWLEDNEFIEREFEPITVELQFQTLNQVNAFYAIFRYSEICEFMRNYDWDPKFEVRQNLENIIGVTQVPIIWTKLLQILKEGVC